MLPKPASRLLLFTLAGLSCTMAGPVNNQSSSVGTNFDGPPPPPYKGSINLSWDPWVIVASTQGNSPNDAKDMWGTAGPNSQIMFADDSWGNTSTFNIFGYEVDGPWDSIGWNVYGNGTTPEWTEVLNPYTLVTRGAVSNPSYPSVRAHHDGLVVSDISVR